MIYLFCLKDAYIFINRRSTNLEFVRRAFQQCVFAKKMIGILRLLNCTNYESFASLHDLLHDIFHINQQYPDYLYSLLNVYDLFINYPSHQPLKSFLLQMIVYRILKVLFFLSDSFGFENSVYIQLLLKVLRFSQLVTKIDYFYHLKFGILLKKIKKVVLPNLDLRLLDPSFDKFDQIFEDDLFHNPKLKKIPPQKFYYFAVLGKKYLDDFELKM